MESYFRRLDLDIQSQPMPLEFRSTSATILCNDCSGKSTVPYHWLGLKCAICRSYNTAEIRLNTDSESGSSSGSLVGRSTSPNQASGSSQGLAVPEQSQTVSEGTISRAIATGQSARIRHSSHTHTAITVPGARAVFPDRLARPASSPPGGGMGMRSSVTPISIVTEDYEDVTDDDMLGLWGHHIDSSSDGIDSLSDEDNVEEEDNEEDDQDDEDEDDDDNEIILIGHR